MRALLAVATGTGTGTGAGARGSARGAKPAHAPVPVAVAVPVPDAVPVRDADVGADVDSVRSRAPPAPAPPPRTPPPPHDPSEDDYVRGLDLLFRNEDLAVSEAHFAASVARCMPGGATPSGALARKAAAQAAFGHALVATLRALMTFGDAERDEAMARLSLAQRAAQAPSASGGAVAAAASWLGLRTSSSSSSTGSVPSSAPSPPLPSPATSTATSPTPTPEDPASVRLREDLLGVDAELVAADAGLLYAVLYFTSESSMGVVRGAVTLRQSFKRYQRATKAAQEYLDASWSGSGSGSGAPSKSASPPLEPGTGVAARSPRARAKPTTTRVVLVDGEPFYDASPDDDSDTDADTDADADTHAHADPRATPAHTVKDPAPALGYGTLIRARAASSVEERVKASALLGTGLFHLVFSLIPPRFQGLIRSVMGFERDGAFSEDADRGKGLRMLRACVDSGTSRAPIAALALLVFHSAMLIVARGVSDDADTREAEHVLDTCLRQYHDSPIFRFFEGRLHRGASRLADALVSYRVAELRAGSVLPLLLLCRYERAWCLALSGGRLAEAGDAFAALVDKTPWSPVFYAYLSATCYLEHAARLVLLTSSDTRDLLAATRASSVDVRASACVVRALALFRAAAKSPKLMGPMKRAIPPEVFAHSRAVSVVAAADALAPGTAAALRASPPDLSLVLSIPDLEALTLSLFCPFHEVAYFWNGLFQIDPAQRARLAADLDALADRARAHPRGAWTRHEPVFLLLKSSLLRETKRADEAESIATALARSKRLAPEDAAWVPEFAKFELGMCAFQSGRHAQALEVWGSIGDSAHPFDPRLKFKVRTAMRTAAARVEAAAAAAEVPAGVGRTSAP